jgi:hypothetical protein
MDWRTGHYLYKPIFFSWLLLACVAGVGDTKKCKKSMSMSAKGLLAHAGLVC